MVSQHGTPVGSHCHPTPNAYFTDDAWLELSTIIAKGIHEMPVVRDHPDWWVYFSLDVFGSHVNLDAANENFTKIKIWIVKEEADTSQTCQEYDRLKAKKDKSHMRPLVDIVASNCGFINQWQLIAICLQALKKGKPSDWIVSFKTVNMHPKHRFKFSDGIIKTSYVLQNTDAYFKTELECVTIFDAIPEFWKAWTPDLRKEVVYSINKLVAGCLPNKYVFSCKMPFDGTDKVCSA